ncbi:MAG: lycopene cyclase domain-containing protein [Actinomycetota bacterium]|nr:lycopene cyclase domain-containing protein [Actinomycetota bacterium]
MRHLTYLGLMLGCLLGTLPLEVVMGARVYRRWRRAAAAIVPVAAVFIAWDGLAVRAEWWSFDYRYLLGPRLGRLPLEELLFFLVIPVCAILTLEAVGRLRPDWRLDDVPDDRPDDPPAVAATPDRGAGP